MTQLSSNLGYIKGFFWFTTFNYKLNLFIGAVIMFLCGHYFGQLAGKAIIIKKKNYILVGLLCGMAVLISTAFLSGLTGFIQQGIENIGTNDDPFEDYIFKPFFWISIFGMIPSSLIGLWFGRQIMIRRTEK